MPRRSGRQARQFDISQLGPAAQAQLRQQLGDAEFTRLAKVKKSGRYTVAPVENRTVDGVVFDSGWESKVYLRLLREFGAQAFALQPRFLLQQGFLLAGKKYRPTYYVADFLVGPIRQLEDEPLRAGQFVVDAKGHKTREYMLKRKLFMGRYGVPIIEIKTPEDLEKLVIKIRDTNK